MVDRVSALTGHYQTGHFGAADETGVVLEEIRDLVLHQVAAWQDSIDAVAKILVDLTAAETAAGPCSATTGSKGTMLRIEPMKWWLYGVEAPAIDSKEGMTLDVSHSRTHVRVTGSEASAFLNRHFPLDLREQSFPVGSVASSVTHHVGVTLWRSSEGYELFIPRGFALSLWEGFVESAEQFGLEVR